MRKSIGRSGGRVPELRLHCAGADQSAGRYAVDGAECLGVFVPADRSDPVPELQKDDACARQGARKVDADRIYCRFGDLGGQPSAVDRFPYARG